MSKSTEVISLDEYARRKGIRAVYVRQQISAMKKNGFEVSFPDIISMQKFGVSWAITVKTGTPINTTGKVPGRAPKKPAKTAPKKKAK